MEMMIRRTPKNYDIFAKSLQKDCKQASMLILIQNISKKNGDFR